MIYKCRRCGRKEKATDFQEIVDRGKLCRRCIADEEKKSKAKRKIRILKTDLENENS